MTPAIGAIIGSGIGLGLILIMRGMDRAAPGARVTPSRPRRLPQIPRRAGIVLAAATLAGLVIAVTTGVWVTVLVAPALAWAIPRMLATNTRSLDRLRALDQWTRQLAGLIEAGHGLRMALIESEHSVPDELREPVVHLVRRLQARHPVTRCLYAFADEVDDPVADKIAAALIKGSVVDETKLVGLLTDLSTMVSEEVRSREQIHGAQSGPRQSARTVMIITTVVLAGIVFATSYGKFYRTPSGQLVLLILVILDALVLWWMHRIASPPPTPRWLTRPRTPAALSTEEVASR